MSTMSTTMIDTPCPGAGRRFVVEASNSDPAIRHGHDHRRSNLADCEIHATRTATSQRARFFLQRGHWVEVYDDDTKELLAGPFDHGPGRTRIHRLRRPNSRPTARDHRALP
jgi:hypothetical protein